MSRPGANLPPGGKFLPPLTAAHSSAQPLVGTDLPASVAVPDLSAPQPGVVAAHLVPKSDRTGVPPMPEEATSAAPATSESVQNRTTSGESAIDRALQLERILRSAPPAPTTIVKPATRQSASIDTSSTAESDSGRPPGVFVSGSAQTHSSVAPAKANVPVDGMGNLREKMPQAIRAKLTDGEVFSDSARQMGDKSEHLTHKPASRTLYDSARTPPVSLGVSAATSEFTMRQPVSNVTGVTTSGVAGPDGAQAAVAEQVGSRLIAMTVKGNNVAKLQLQPAELGSLEIRITMQDDGAVVSINAQQPHARELIEAGLPRLRDMFEASGTSLLDVNIAGNGDGSTDDRNAEEPQTGSASAEASAPANAEPNPQQTGNTRTAAHRLDLWA